MQIWRMQKGAEKKFRYGHPWVFSNDLGHSPKDLPPGERVELQDSGGQFLAYGYGHPNTLIAFRVLSRNPAEVPDREFLCDRLSAAAQRRRLAGVAHATHRLCFAEADGLPGLIIDRYLLEGEPARQVFVLQASTAGMDRLLPEVLAALEEMVGQEHAQALSPIAWSETGVVIANDSKSRLMEGLAVEEKRAVRELQGVDLDQVKIRVQSAAEPARTLPFLVDLIGGQKTGFFLDQRENVRLTAQIVRQFLAAPSDRPLRVLDLCCYVGQWATQLAHLAQTYDRDVEVTLVDASSKALELAELNAREVGGRVTAEKLDVLKDLGRLPIGHFDIVICDPPAFIKKKKDIPTGQSAYYKLNREAVRRVRPGGVFVSCSCSGLLTDEDFRGILARVSVGGTPVRWLLRGTQSPDHPMLAEFPQGIYLKSWIGLLS